MVNHVLNEVKFQGLDSDLMLAEYFFLQMGGRKPKNEEGKWPYFSIEFPQGSFAQIEANLFAGTLSVKYQTDLHSNLENLERLAEYFGLNFESTYVEHGNGYYGACRYNEGKFLHAWMEDSDLMQINYDPEQEKYTFQDIVFKCRGECYDHILKEKLDALQQVVDYSRGR